MEKIELKRGLKVMFTLYHGNELARAKSLVDKLEPDSMIPLDGTELQILRRIQVAYTKQHTQ